MVDIFDEIQEDLRAERVQGLLKRYGVLLVVAVVLVIAGVAGWQAWRWRSQQQASETATAFLGAMKDAAATPAGPASASSRAKAAAEFAALAESAPQGYRTLARFREAALKVSADDLPGALALWDKVAADNGADPLLRGLADLLWVQHQVDAGEPAVVEGRLAGLVGGDSPWRPMALESQAWLDIRTGQTGKARDILKGLQADKQAPDGVRARAGGLLSQIAESAPAPVQGAGG